MKRHDLQIIHSSEESDWRTPEPLVTALNDEEYGGIEIDLAADRENRKFPIWLGPGSPWGEDALAVDWSELMKRLNLAPIGFLNPPFSRKRARELKAAGEAYRHYLVERWAAKCWEESRRGFTIYTVLPFAPQTDWYRHYVYGHTQGEIVDGVYPTTWADHAALQERRLPHRISFLRPDGSPAQNAGVNSVIVKWGPARGIVGPWQPHTFYWSYR